MTSVQQEVEVTDVETGQPEQETQPLGDTPLGDPLGLDDEKVEEPRDSEKIALVPEPPSTASTGTLERRSSPQQNKLKRKPTSGISVLSPNVRGRARESGCARRRRTRFVPQLIARHCRVPRRWRG